MPYSTVIEEPGIYSGDLGTVLIKTTSGTVEFENFVAEEITNYEGQDEGGGFYPGAKVIARNGKFIGVNPNKKGKGQRRAGWFNGAAGVEITNCDLEGTRGFWLQDIKGPVKVMFNTAYNLNSAGSDGKGGYDFYSKPVVNPKDQGPNCQFVILLGTKGQDVEIAYNAITGVAYEMLVEDTINIGGSSGTKSNPIRIHSNLIAGAFAQDPANTTTSMALIQIEGKSDFVEAYDNYLAYGCNGALFVSWGDNNKFYRNKVRCSGIIPSGPKAGEFIRQMWLGLALYNPGWQKPVGNCEAFDNDVKFARIWDDGSIHPTEIFVQESTGNKEYNNEYGPAPTPQEEAILVKEFWDMIESKGLVLGANGDNPIPPEPEPPGPTPKPEPEPDPIPKPGDSKKDLLALRKEVALLRNEIRDEFVKPLNALIKEIKEEIAKY